jgi:CHAD domain-containing protein
MKPSARWLVSDGDRVPARQVAARTLRFRLDTVWAELQAACADGQTPERVHRLRVATRRTLAAIEAFRDLLPAHRAAWFEKRLRRIRRSAGDARDLDVLTERLSRKPLQASPPASTAGQGARGRLVAMLSRKRDVSRLPIRRLCETLSAADWTGRTERLVDGIARRRGRIPFGRYARRRFKPLMERFFNRADHKLRDAAEIHRLRIEGKKLRYSLEIFAGVFPSRVRAKCQDSLERLQRTLGEFTDHAAAADRFRRWSREDGAGAERDALTALRKEEDALADKARQAFGKWWNAARRRQLRRAFERTLRRRTSA